LASRVCDPRRAFSFLTQPVYKQMRRRLRPQPVVGRTRDGSSLRARPVLFCLARTPTLENGMRRVLLLVVLAGAAALTAGCDDKKTSATSTTTVT
jgi:hypothetical protein